MTSTTSNRDDLFTNIHKALRLGLFEITAQTGRTDWADPEQVSDLGIRWHALLELLRAHTAHEDEYILRILDPHDPVATEPAGDQHRDLDDLLADLAARFDAILAQPDPVAGLGIYRDLARFVAAYLPHLHDEETRIMARIWECCTDDEIADTRARFMVKTTPDVQATSIEYLLPAIDGTTRRALIASFAAAPPAVLDSILAIASRVLPHDEVLDLRTCVA